ncbi:MAG: HD domain-containing phosphohydrolase, partial [Gemmatimonadales bacterium]
EARLLERAGRSAEAEARYLAAAGAAKRSGEDSTRSEALRLAGILAWRRGAREEALALCGRSLQAAERISAPLLLAQALNTQAVMALEVGELSRARELFFRALPLSAGDDDVVARIEQNLGIIDNIQGNLEDALQHYQRSLQSYTRAGNGAGRALAYHNLGMISADQKRWDRADRYFTESRELAHTTGDRHLEGLCLLNRAEVLIARQQYDEARGSAEQALVIFDQLDSRLDKADAYRMLGVVFREIHRPELAEARLTSARRMAADAGSVLSEAEACRELGQLYQDQGRNREALTLLDAAHGLFERLEARTDLGDVHARAADLEGTYLRVVRGWGQSIESADTYTHGHCTRVADYAVRVAAALGLDDAALTTIRVGAYLHDVGKVRIPHEVINKPGRLSDAEFEIIKLHPVYGLELLDGIEFPWDIKPIIRWHHEKYDGTGYPDGLVGEEIPVHAQVICIVDVYDALTTTRSYRPAMSHETALETMRKSRSWWRDDVYE